MATYLDRIAAHKIDEVALLGAGVAERSARLLETRALPGEKPFIIAEIKRSSPSEGAIRMNADVGEIARAYRDHGAGMISVLTDVQFFNGGFDLLREARETVDLPILCKDFIIDRRQIDHAWSSGADAILLIAAILDRDRMRELAGYARECGLEVLFEIHDIDEYAIIEGANPRYVGVNSRNLASFTIDPEHAAKVIGQLPENLVIVAESGIASPAHIRFYRNAGATGFLVGTSLMKADDPGKALAGLVRELG